MYNSYNATLKTPYLLINDHKKFQEHDIKAKSDNKNLGKMAKENFFQLGFSSEIEVPQLGWARLEPENSSSGSSLIVGFHQIMKLKYQKDTHMN